MMKRHDLTFGALADMLTRAQIAIGHYNTEPEDTNLRVDLSEAADLIRWEIGSSPLCCEATQPVIERDPPAAFSRKGFTHNLRQVR